MWALRIASRWGVVRVSVESVVAVRIVDHGPEPEWHRGFGPWWRFEADIPDFPLVNERGMSPWEAVHRLVSNHRTVLERRWSEDADEEHVRRPDALIDLGDWNVGETGEVVQLGCVVMAPATLTGGRPPLDVISEELPFDVRVLAEWVLQLWGQARELS